MFFLRVLTSSFLSSRDLAPRDLARCIRSRTPSTGAPNQVRARKSCIPFAVLGGFERNRPYCFRYLSLEALSFCKVIKGLSRDCKNGGVFSVGTGIELSK